MNWIVKTKAYNSVDGISDDDIFVKKVYESYSSIISPIDTVSQHDVSFQGSQKPYEFLNACKTIQERLKDEETPSMLEIGAFKGLWSIAFFEWCILNNKVGTYYTVTWMMHNPANEDLLKVQKYYSDKGFTYKILDYNSQLQSTKDELLKDRTDFSFVFIDADHSYDGVKADIELYSSMATKVLGFHDIRPKENTSIGVYKAIVDSKINLDKEIISDDNHMGIGLKFIG